MCLARRLNNPSPIDRRSPVRLIDHRFTLELEHVEDHVREADGGVPVQESVADEREVRLSLEEGDKLPVEDASSRQVRKLGQQRGHLPAAPRQDAELLVTLEERPEAVPFQLEGVVWNRPGRDSIGSGSRIATL
jgi:hypothetical protein